MIYFKESHSKVVMMAIPSGTVTFLFTDIEGSTRLWENHQHAMQDALKQHDQILKSTIETHNGYVFKTVGDAFCASFATASDALAAAIEIQQQVQTVVWEETPIRIRMALHTGSVEEREGDYFGRAVNRVARLEAAGHGGQVLVSSVTQGLLADNLQENIGLKDLGVRRLKDLERPEHIYQVQIPGHKEELPQLKTIDIRPNNLPVQVTSFIGREKEIQEIRDLLKPARLLTIAGPGGIGKTRISLHATAELLDAFHDGVWFIDLVSVTDQDTIWQAIATPLGIHEETAIPLQKTVTERIQGKEILLLLDNCEHLVESTAKATETLLRECPKLKILATSREALSIAGETLYKIKPLSVPDLVTSNGLKKAEEFDAADLTEFESVRLFIDRALQVKQDFTVTNKNAPALAQICSWLDGIPLAIELAASRVKIFSLQELHKRLSDRFKVLSKGLRTAPPRQQTLRALIDWSYNLLEEDEKTLFKRLAVFSGGWTVDSAETICGSNDPLPVDDPPGWRDWIDPEHNHPYKSGLFLSQHAPPAETGTEGTDTLEILERLIDKSLVITDQLKDSTRFHMLETIRQYAKQKSESCGEAESIEERHMAYYTLFVEDIDHHIRWGNTGLWDPQYDVEYPNIRTCFETSLKRPHYYAYGCRIASALFEFWSYHGRIGEGRKWIDHLSDHIIEIKEPHLRAWTEIRCGWIYHHSYKFKKARQFFDDAIQICEQQGFTGGSAGARLGLGNLLLSSSLELTDAEKNLILARDYFHASGIVRSYNVALLGLSILHFIHENLDEACELLSQVISAEEKTDRKWILHLACNNYAWLECLQGNYNEAKGTAQKGLISVTEYGDRTSEFLLLHTYTTALVGMDETEEAIRQTASMRKILDENENTHDLFNCTTIEGYIFLTKGNLEAAFSKFGSASQLSKTVYPPDEELLQLLIGICALLIKENNEEEYTLVIGFINHTMKNKLSLIPPFMRELYYTVLDKISGSLGEKRTAELMQEGAGLTPEATLELAGKACKVEGGM